MDYTAILEALDARTLQAFQAWGETFAAGMKAALDERDARIVSLEKEVRMLGNQIKTDWDAAESRDATLSDRLDETQKQVRAMVDDAVTSLAVPKYKGVFDRDAAYQAGDMVTHKGSVWHCNAATDGETPGAGEGWTLAVKCGRDGRDGRDAKQEGEE